MAPDERTRAERAADWIGWHLLELAGVAVPAGLAAAASPWWLAGTALSGGLWARAELRAATASKQIPPPLTDAIPPAAREADAG